MYIDRLARWLSLKDYDDAIKSARIAVIKRYARGNVSFQNGNVLDDEAFQELHRKGDIALSNLIAQQEEYSKNGKPTTASAAA